MVSAKEGKGTSGNSSHQQRAMAEAETPTMTLMALPNELLRRILDFIPYDRTCVCRLVCRQLDRIARQHLNAGFRRLEQFHGRSMAKVKLHLPRRESERRSHPLSRHSDILTAIETRLSLLGMTYNKFIDLDLCCFIPGKVLDETFAILRVLNRSLDDKTQPARPHELLQELRDISSMAMEHFDEKMAPVLRDRALSGCSPVKNARDSLSMVMIGALRCNAASPITPASLSSSLSACSSMSLLPTISKQQPSSSTASEVAGENERLRARVKAQGTQMVQIKKELTAFKCRQGRTERQVSTLEKKVGDQSRVIDDQKRKLEEFARKFNEVSRKMLQYDSLLTDFATDYKARADDDEADRPSTSRAAEQRHASNQQSRARKRPTEVPDDDGAEKKRPRRTKRQ